MAMRDNELRTALLDLTSVFTVSEMVRAGCRPETLRVIYNMCKCPPECPTGCDGSCGCRSCRNDDFMEIPS